MLSFGLAKDDAPHHMIWVGLNPGERAKVDKGGFVELSYKRLGLEPALGEGSILIFGTKSDEDGLAELRKRRPDLDWPPDQEET